MKTLEAIANEKADLYGAIADSGAAIVPADAPCADLLLARAQATSRRVIRFGRNGVEAKLLSYAEDEDGANAEADILGARIKYRVGAPGAPWANNALAALTAVAAIGADLKTAAAALEKLRPPPGRGAAKRIAGARGEFTLIDDAYNASPVSVAAAIETLGRRQAKRRIAVLGDMLELGPEEAAYHAGLSAPLESARVDLVFLAGPRMRALWDALPQSRRGGYAETSDALAPLVTQVVSEGDAVLVKGSFGSKMGRIVESLSAMAAPA
jgi:UDP-N-acetylmuramoyl-tripeptide--D-alanyl-D-alanine ligase